MADNTEKPISVREFRMWLQGVEEMQDDDWTPSPQQWKRIRQKINSINEAAPPAPAPAAPPPPPLQIASPTFVNPNARAPGLTLPEQAIPAGPSSLVIPQSRPQMNPLLAGGGGQIKTPDIDTSANGYESGFV